jgi:hypothetical protein
MAGKSGGKSGGTPGGGKTGGSRGSGNGKKGGCLQGHIVALCLPLDVYQAVKDAFDHAVESAGRTETCPVGSMEVHSR